MSLTDDPNVRTDDPNLRTDPTTGDQYVLERGDEGYVDPNERAEGRTEEAASVEEVPEPQDLTLTQMPGESDAEFMERQRTTVVVSENPSDIVPNTPQITMGAQEEIEEATPVEVVEGEPEPEARREEEEEESRNAE